MPIQRNDGLDLLIFVAIDKASPIDLKGDKNLNTLPKIETMDFEDLQVVDGYGTQILWIWINAHIHLYGGKQVADAVSKKIKDVEGVINAVYATVSAGTPKPAVSNAANNPVGG